MGNRFSQKMLMLFNTFRDTDALIERIEAQMFNEVDAIHLKGIDFGSKFDTFAFLASDDGTDIILINTDNQSLDFFSLKRKCFGKSFVKWCLFCKRERENDENNKKIIEF